MNQYLKNRIRLAFKQQRDQADLKALAEQLDEDEVDVKKQLVNRQMANVQESTEEAFSSARDKVEELVQSISDNT